MYTVYTRVLTTAFIRFTYYENCYTITHGWPVLLQGETCKYQYQGKRKWRVGEWLVAGALLLPESWHPASTSISVRENDDPRVGRAEVFCFCKQHSSSTWSKIADVNKETRSLYCLPFVTWIVPAIIVSSIRITFHCMTWRKVSIAYFLL